MPISAINEFLRVEAAGGIILIFAETFAIVLVNLPLSELYTSSLEIPVSIQIHYEFVYWVAGIRTHFI